MALRTDKACHECCEDEDGLEALAEHDDGRVRDHRDVRLRAAADLLLRAGERVVSAARVVEISSSGACRPRSWTRPSYPSAPYQK